MEVYVGRYMEVYGGLWRYMHVYGGSWRYMHVFEILLYRAIEKLSRGEAHKVVSTVADENGFEASSQVVKIAFETKA